MSTAQPDAQQLALAYRQLRRPNTWPATLEAALAHPIYGKCLRAMARQLGRAQWRPAPVTSTLPQGPAVPPTPASPPQRQQARLGPQPGPQQHCWQRTGVDLKRAAANDRDD